MEKFDINENVSVVCESEKTRYGFRHVAVLLKDGEELCRDKACYYNRTWESFEFETVLYNVLGKSKLFSNCQINEIISAFRTKVVKKFDSLFSTVANVALMGEVLCEKKEEKNKWKERMIKAGLSGVDFPEDWDSLSEDVKEARLNGIIEFMKNKDGRG